MRWKARSRQAKAPGKLAYVFCARGIVPPQRGSVDHLGFGRKGLCRITEIAPRQQGTRQRMIKCREMQDVSATKYLQPRAGSCAVIDRYHEKSCLAVGRNCGVGR